MKTDNRKKTDNIELVETYNIALALRRCRNAPGWDDKRTARALVHALGMAGGFGHSEQKAIREALNLP